MNDTGDDLSRPADAQSLAEQAEQKERAEPRLFGTFGGVFVPTLLTILGVIMYLREGWVVGNAGLLGAWLIILLSFAITGFTGLSLSSITTNIRIGAGGAFSVISQSLGLEVGGSVGMPLYLAQALAVAMYIFGFRAGWQWVFPDHPALIIDLATFGVLFLIAFISAGLAFKIQYAILAVIILSLISVVISVFGGVMEHPVKWWGEFPGSPENAFKGIGFWAVFAVFFPASTGIMAGANMSGELKNARRSIPVGTMAAIGLSLIVYLGLAYWLARSAPTEELVRDYAIMIEKSSWGPVVLAGLLGATFSSALTSLVGAPRILQGLGSRNILPGGKWFATRSKRGEPRNALFLTGAIVLAALMLRNLNAVAPLITMFFLLTYAMINVVVFLEQTLKLVSFRPLLRIPRPVSLLGACGCVFAMFIVNPAFSLIALVVVAVIHAYLIRRHLRAPRGDVRSGLYVAVAEWAAKKVGELTASRERTWKANLLVPVERVDQLRRLFSFICDISYPKGFLKIVGLTGRESTEEDLVDRLPDVADDFIDQGVFASWTVITVAAFGSNLQAGIETFAGTFFKPNVVLLRLPEDPERRQEVDDIIETCRQNKVGVLLLVGAPELDETGNRSVNVWIDPGDNGWELGSNLGDADLALLVGYKLKMNWKAEMRLVARIRDRSAEAEAEEYLRLVSEAARIPNAATYVAVPDAEGDVPGAAIHIFAMPSRVDLEDLSDYSNRLNAPCMFALDSGQENALA